jgi:hypothetical protein
MTFSGVRRPDPAGDDAIAAEAAEAVARRVSTAYAPFYAAFAVVSLVLALLPPFENVSYGDPRSPSTVTFDTLLDMAERDGGGPALFGLLLLALLVALLVTAAFRVRSAVLPVWSAGLAVLLALMLVARPGTGTRTPDLTGAGQAALAVLFAIGTLAAAHAIHLTVARRRR